MPSMTVLSLGGNAILPASRPGRIEEQFRVTEATMVQVLGLLRAGERVILTHGNGPIVGNILIRNEAAANLIPPTPLYICGADSQGGIGLMIQQALHNVSNREGIDTHVVTVITQTVVDPRDPAFANPTKPIGPFYSDSEARAWEREREWKMVADAGRGWRRVVASPEPIRIVELETIRTLVGIGQVVIAAGGGGIPVLQTESGEYHGVEAVVDKDLASVVLGAAVGAQRLIIVTVVDRVALNYGKPDQKDLETMTVAEARRHFDEGQFPPGSMGPKILGAIRFLESGGREVLITSPNQLARTLAGEGGTRIVP
ncbi:MAG: carbamate kinase [Candidatus Eisenbacteria sp.]|nr:carbamate kinase [Candidatus Eisenbacteria bacterium]